MLRRYLFFFGTFDFFLCKMFTLFRPNIIIRENKRLLFRKKYEFFIFLTSFLVNCLPFFAWILLFIDLESSAYLDRLVRRNGWELLYNGVFMWSKVYKRKLLNGLRIIVPSCFSVLKSRYLILIISLSF